MRRAIQRTSVYESRIFSVEECRFTTQEGVDVDRSVVRHPGAVLIVPILPDGQLVMIRNWRVALEQSLWEFPAGTLEPDEPPVESAGRELTEETGYRADSIEFLGSFYTSPGFADELMHVFVATGLKAGQQVLEAHEEITVESKTWQEVRSMVNDGTLVDGKSLAAIQLWSMRQSTQGDD
ncbi:MAG: NUDIX hydrolase [Phycisphaerales bacterium]|nr:NUDIX hydrolase [Phycisphaerales bacterium]